MTNDEMPNPEAEACAGEPASRNASELDSASLYRTGVAKLPQMLTGEPDAGNLHVRFDEGE